MKKFLLIGLILISGSIGSCAELTQEQQIQLLQQQLYQTQAQLNQLQAQQGYQQGYPVNQTVYSGNYSYIPVNNTPVNYPPVNYSPVNYAPVSYHSYGSNGSSYGYIQNGLQNADNTLSNVRSLMYTVNSLRSLF